MTAPTFLKQLDSRLIGFENLFSEIERLATRQQDGYPPHNLIKVEDNHYQIELAVAGFSESDLTIEHKDSVLHITGEITPIEKEYLHKGISARKFSKTFRLAEHVVVHAANYNQGLLTIDLKVVIPEEKKPKLIPINSGSPQTLELLTESV